MKKEKLLATALSFQWLLDFYLDVAIKPWTQNQNSTGAENKESTQGKPLLKQGAYTVDMCLSIPSGST